MATYPCRKAGCGFNLTPYVIAELDGDGEKYEVYVDWPDARLLVDRPDAELFVDPADATDENVSRIRVVCPSCETVNVFRARRKG